MSDLLGGRNKRLELLIAEHVYDFTQSIAEKIKKLIGSCDVGIILLTNNGLNSQFVSEEIGYLEAKGKPVIRIIEKGFAQKYSGFKFGSDYIVLDPMNPTKAQNDLIGVLLEYDKQFANKRTAWLIAGAICLILFTQNDK